MTRLEVVRTRPLGTAEAITAVMRHPAIYELGALIPARQPVGRRLHHPGYLLVAYGVLARLFRSSIRVQTELRHPATWTLIRDSALAMADQLPDGVWQPPGQRPPGWEAFRYIRERYLTDPTLQDELLARFTELAVDQAWDAGLLDPSGPGSLAHPHPSRTIYGDGTVIKPMYRPPTARRETDPATGKTRVIYLDPATCDPVDAPTRRFDPDAAEFHGHAGPVHGTNIVAVSVRGDTPYSRVVLGVDRVDRPGREADTAVALIKRVHTVAGAGIQAVVYDGAFRGTHIDELMTDCGLVVVNKVHAAPATQEQKAARGGKKNPRWSVLGDWEHDTPAGPCHHQLAAVDGAVSEIGLDDAGRPVQLHRLERKQVKRPRRASGRYHFSVAYEVPCDAGAFLAWVTPHSEPHDHDARRADAVRIIPEGDPDFAALYGRRNDSESLNSQLKRTLIVDRAMSLGWRRLLLDVLCFGVLNNAVSAYQLQAATVSAYQLQAATAGASTPARRAA